MTPQELRASILQLAIQGKLVEQKTTDENVDDTLALIGKKREALIKAGELKKLGKINKTSEVDLDIPDTWRFVCLSEIICKRVDNRGKTPSHSLTKTEEYCIDLLEINAIVPGKAINHENVEKFISESTYATLRGYVEKDDILIATVGSVGKFAMMDDTRSAIAQNIIAIKCFEEVNQKYIFYLLQTPYFYASMGNITMEAVQASIKVPDLMNLRVPLPPLTEQKRIVAKIEELLPLIDRYEQAWSKLEEFNKRFPVDMQKSILQTAIQGKLVEQRPQEGTGDELFQQIQAEKQALVKAGKIKKEKPLPEITEDDIPFDIPDSWKWAKIGDTFSVIRGSSPRPKGSPLYWSSTPTKHHWVTIKDITSFAENGFLFQTHEFLTDEGAKKSTFVPGGELIIAVSGSTTGKFCILGIDGYIYDGLAAIINPTNIIGCEYLKYFFMWIYERLNAQKIGSAFPNINTDMLKNTLIPLPPLAEQKRIVAKLEEILPLCERLK